jgi:CubicO group peptidase (beta-lactamase class C family)
VLVLGDGRPVAEVTHGVEAAFVDQQGTPRPEQTALTAATRFDLASITKLFTAALLLEELADHGLGLQTPVAQVLPGYGQEGRSQVRFAHLLTHTSGLPAEWSGWRDGPSPESARRAVLGLRPTVAPGAVHRYSCVGYLHAGFAAEALAGEPLDALLHRRITGPLGLTSTGYRPAPGTPVAATEWQELPVPGITHGEVHDETARSVGGVAGNAGVFATARDLARFGEALRVGAPGVLRESTRELMTRPLVDGAGYGQAAGPRIGDGASFGRLATDSLGHTGFTGTLLLVRPRTGLTLVVLTNAVHPDRRWNAPSVFRGDVAAVVADSAGGG